MENHPPSQIRIRPTPAPSDPPAPTPNITAQSALHCKNMVMRSGFSTLQKILDITPIQFRETRCGSNSHFPALSAQYRENWKAQSLPSLR